LAAEIKKTLGIDAQLVEGGRGAFEVFRDGTLVYSKLQRGFFPSSNADVVALLR
jgi:selT/selW/selH-like putative selenoprotein